MLHSQPRQQRSFAISEHLHLDLLLLLVAGRAAQPWIEPLSCHSCFHIGGPSVLAVLACQGSALKLPSRLCTVTVEVRVGLRGAACRLKTGRWLMISRDHCWVQHWSNTAKPEHQERLTRISPMLTRLLGVGSTPWSYPETSTAVAALLRPSKPFGFELSHVHMLMICYELTVEAQARYKR